MANLLVAIVGDTNPTRTYSPPLRDPNKAKRAAEELGAELAKRGGRLLVYGGPFLETDVVRGFVAGKPPKDRSILMWYTKGQEPAPFSEEATHPKLFERRLEKGVDWEIAFYRSIARADAVILIGGENATKISGQVAIGSRLAILALPEFGGAAAKVWETLSAGEDLPNRAEIDLMARPWAGDSAVECVNALVAQHARRDLADGAPRPILSIVAAALFAAALAIVPWIWGKNAFEVWMLFIAPLLAGGAGAAIRPMVDRQRGVPGVAPMILATVVLGLVAGGIAGVLFVTPQFTAEPNLIANAATADQNELHAEFQKLLAYARRSIPYAVGVGFVAGLTSDAVFGKLLGLDVVRTSGTGTPHLQA